jgi:hypothetical protein
LPSAIEQAHRAFKDAGLTVLAVNLGEDRATVAAWVRAKGVTSTVLLDPDGVAQRAYRVTATPTVVLVGRDGRLVGRAHGNRPWMGEKGRRLFQALLAK